MGHRERGVGEPVRLRAHRDDLDGAQPQVEGVEQARVEIHALRRNRQHAVEQDVGALAPDVVAGEDGKTGQVLGGQPGRVGDRLVDRGVRTHHQPLRIIGGEVVAAIVVVGVVAVERSLPGQRRKEIFARPGGFVERERRPDHGRIIGREARQQQFARPP